MEKLGETIKQLAQSKGITIKELAEKINMTETGYYASIRNKSMKLEKLLKISEVLGEPLSTIVAEEKARYTNKQSGIGNQVGNNNKQKIMDSGNQGVVRESSEANLNNLQHELELCQRENSHLKSQLALQENFIEFLKKNQK